MSRFTHKKILYGFAWMVMCACAPLSASAYNQAYYEGYYQPYYQPYYQAYYQPYYQGYYQGLYQGSYLSASSSAIYLTSGTSWTVPADWSWLVSSTIEVIGAGGGGQSGAGLAGGIGGGGGGYSKIYTPLNFTPGASISYSIGAGGAGGVGISAAGSNGGATYFNGTSCAKASVCARGGSGGAQAGTGAIGLEGIGTTRYYGGTSRTPVDARGTGGGGAAGPSGAGANASTSPITTGGAGDAGYGGAGGLAGSTGSSGTEFDSTHGAGGGGGGGGGGVAGGNGGSYGGGGGGGGAGGFSGGTGGGGLIVISYVSSTTPPAPVEGPPGTTADVTITVNTKIKGNLFITGALSKGSGTFVIDHPLNPRNELLYHSFVESPQAVNLYDGIATLDQNGEAVVVLPNYFEALNRDFRYQFFALDEAMPDLYIKKEVANNRFTIAGGSKGGRVSWQVTGVRHDPYILKNPIINEVEKDSKTPVGKGQCLFEPLCE